MVRIIRSRLFGAALVLALFGLYPTVQAAGPDPSAQNAKAMPFPIQLGGPFDLVDHNGDRRTEKDFLGRHLLIFFGYANCPGICSAALPSMAAAVDALGKGADNVQPVLITVDPEWDTPEEMKRVLSALHPRLLGLTGDEESLAAVREAYQIEFSKVGDDIFGKPIYSHGGYVYLMGPDGELETVIPPILSPSQMAAIIRDYITPAS
ncbi:SCO family protein [Hwanghaeella grinnelliae]|uniref:SCO family protein n=1 Tax=Hwanghaeella grinnelliae TaxID=2500179 RepID=A0A3S2VM54_9PROT|nr:SCO family protein [Hwanghaeella grinnelliae]RVU33709.1 SCO family protein [Hwanghaeella grinnelliae]